MSEEQCWVYVVWYSPNDEPRYIIDVCASLDVAKARAEADAEEPLTWAQEKALEYQHNWLSSTVQGEGYTAFWRVEGFVLMGEFPS